MNTKKLLMLVILDGFGMRKDPSFNAVLGAHMTNYFSLWNNYPHTQLHASGPLVGLPEGQIGSSEVGHLTLGSGRLVKQPIVRINEDIETGKFFSHPSLLSSFSKKKNIHLMGLLGPGGVHSHSDHLYALLTFYDKHANEFEGKVFVHCFLDGRDTPQQSALEYLRDLEEKISYLKHKEKFVIATLCGRYYAMDRDKRDERTQVAFEMLMSSVGEKSNSFEEAINLSYKDKVYDEFVKPVVLEHENITSNDLCVWYNFRADRPRQLVSKLLTIKRLKVQTLTEYSPEFDVDVLYPTLIPEKTVGEILSKNNLCQLRISESEKYPHVTYFFNGLKHRPFPLETQVKIASPKVATYDLKPEMSSEEVTRRVCKEIRSKKHDFILLNFANSDMVGHTGDYDAVVKALKAVDNSLKEIKDALDEVEGTLAITADHGNCETMRDENNKPHTKHTYNLVPFILCKKDVTLRKDYENLSLSHVGPTLLELLNLKKPKEMRKDSLLRR